MTFLNSMVYGDGQLKYLLPGVQEAERKLRADANAIGIEYRIANFGGARTLDIVTQLIQWRDEAVKNGEPYYRVSPYGKTKHARGGAFDVAITKRPDGMSTAQAYAKLGALARPHGLLWGGNFPPPADVYHFESQQSLEQLDARWKEWVNSPDYPRLGFADISLLVLLALLFILLIAYHHVRA